MEQAESKKENFKKFLEQMYGKAMSDDEVEEYNNNLVKLFGLFVQIDQKNKKGKKWK